MKLQLKVCRFDRVEEIQQESQNVLRTLWEQDFQHTFQQWQRRWDQCVWNHLQYQLLASKSRGRVIQLCFYIHVVLKGLLPSELRNLIPHFEQPTGIKTFLGLVSVSAPVSSNFSSVGMYCSHIFFLFRTEPVIQNFPTVLCIFLSCGTVNVRFFLQNVW